MKKLENLKIKELSVLRDSEMKSVLGGYTNLQDLRADKALSPKQEACVGKNEGDPCSFEWGATSHGKCRRSAGSQQVELHCSDMRQV